MAQKKKWSASLKFEIVLLTLKGQTTLNEICKRYEVAPSQVHALSDAHILSRKKPPLVLKFKFLQSAQHNDGSGWTFTRITIPST